MDYNPDYPEVLGPQFLMTRDQKSRIYFGAPGRIGRYPSTTTENISALRLSLAVNPLSTATVPVVIDIVEEGQEYTNLPTLARLKPNADAENGGWVTDTGSTTNLWERIDGDTSRWPPAPGTTITDIRTFTPGTEYSCHVDASAFAPGGAAASGRIYWVAVEAILATNTGHRPMSIKLEIDGKLYDPAGGATREGHAFGVQHGFWWGEINPATGLPWTPADIADFGPGGGSRIRIRSGVAASTAQYPRVVAVSLNVHYSTVENRVAVGVWRRPENIGTERLINITTDELVAVPGGTGNWAKQAGKNYLIFPRHSVSPWMFGSAIGDDLRWNGAYQDLGPDGKPAAIVYPLHHSGEAPPPADRLASERVVYDQFGRPQTKFEGNSRAAYALVMVRASDGQPSVDSHPYRLDLADVVTFNHLSGTTGQRLTPSTSEEYVGFRLPVIPPFADAEITVSVHRVSDGQQVGGSYTATALEVGKIRHGDGGLRYLTGFFDSPVPVQAGTAYEIRLKSASTGAGQDNWIVFAPDCSLGPEASFGGTSAGAVINGTHVSSRDLMVNLIREPDPPANVTATIIDVPVNVAYVAEQVPTVEHVAVQWTAPAIGMGTMFSHYEVERQEDGGDWHLIAKIGDPATTRLPDDDHEVPRDTEVRYRVRAVGLDGRISDWAESNAVTPTAPGAIVILTSNHDPSREVVYFFDTESTYPILSAERDETVLIHGSDAAVTFMEAEDRGIGWRTTITINQVSMAGKGGHHVLRPLLDLIRPEPGTGALRIPYVCVLDHEGTRIMGHVKVSEVPHRRPQRIYTAQIDATPNYTRPVPVEID